MSPAIASASITDRPISSTPPPPCTQYATSVASGTAQNAPLIDRTLDEFARAAPRGAAVGGLPLEDDLGRAGASGRRRETRSQLGSHIVADR